MPPDAPAPYDAPAAIQRLSALVEQLIARNGTLVAECDSLYEHIESLTQQLSAREADILSLKQNRQDAQAPNQLLRDEAERDQRRIERLRAELDAYLSEIDARRNAREAYV